MLLLIALAAAQLPQTTMAFTCRVPTAHDGDNVRCDGYRSARLASIDAPDFEKSPRCRPPKKGAICDDVRATRSRDHLRALIAAGPVVCRREDADPRRRGFQWVERYGRAILSCRTRAGDVSAAQRDGGYATSWP